MLAPQCFVWGTFLASEPRDLGASGQPWLAEGYLELFAFHGLVFVLLVSLHLSLGGAGAVSRLTGVPSPC